MKLSIKQLIICVVFYAALCSASDEDDACIIQFLKRKGMLSADYQEIVAPSSNCPYVYNTFVVQMIKSELNDDITKVIPNKADCLTNENE